jgi:integrase/recombinase XerD
VKNGILDIIQIKTSERLQMQLHTDAISILETQNKSSEYIFNLPSHTGCLKSIRKWVKDAEIDKHITWHCARHSFATALVVEDTNITTVSKLLGHKSLSETMTYVRVAELSKINAINNLPSIYKAI